MGKHPHEYDFNWPEPHYCEVCDEPISAEQAYTRGGLCEDCYIAECEAEAELDDRV